MFKPYDEREHGPSIDGAVAYWAGKRPDEAYNWRDPAECACGQYAREIGRVKEWFGHSQCRGGRASRWDMLNTIARGGGPEDWTFGKLVTRAKEHVA